MASCPDNCCIFLISFDLSRQYAAYVHYNFRQYGLMRIRDKSAAIIMREVGSWLRATRNGILVANRSPGVALS
jgi:hypothetical protein